MWIRGNRLEIRLDDVVVGQRFRKDFGDLEGLAESIADIGLLQPIGVDGSNRLVFGERRLRACRMLGWETIPARMVDLDLLIKGEYAENELRKDFTVSERVAIGKALEEQLGERRGRPTELENPANLPEFQGKETREIAAQQAGFGGARTYQYAKNVVENGAPELVEAMDRGEVSVSAAADVATLPRDEQVEIVARGEREILEAAKRIRSEVREKRRSEIIARLNDVSAKEVKALSGEYDVIVIDPPWPMQKIERDVTPNQVAFEYPTMTEEQLAELQLPAGDDCHMWLWTTHKYLPMALRLLDVWDFKYVCTFVWHKPGGFQPFDLPQYNCEFALYARKGSPSFIDTKAFPTCFEAPRGAHSEKPEEFYDMVRRVTAGVRIDIFNRRRIEGFDVWGNEAHA